MPSGKLILTLLDSQVSQAYNQFIYGLQKIPFLGKYVSDKWYGQMEFKGILLGLSLLWSGIKRLFLNLAYYLLLIGSLGIMLENKDSLPNVMQPFLQGDLLLLFKNILVVWHLLAFSLFQSKLFVPGDRDLFVATRLFRLPARTYLMISEQSKSLTKLLFMSLALGFVLRGESWWQGLFFTILTLACRLFLRSGLSYLGGFSSSRFNQSQNVVIGLGVLPIFLGLLYWIFRGTFKVGFFFSPWALVLGLVLWLLAGLSLWCNPHLDRLARQTLAVENISSPSSPQLALELAQVEVAEEDLLTSDLTEEVKEQGLAYLNTLFVRRFSGIIGKRIRMTIVFLILVTLLLNGLRYFLSDFAPISSQYFGKFLAVSLYLGFLFYLGEYLMKLSFYHMDRPLLHYRFYRQKKAILSLLRTRFIWSLKLNFPIFLTLLVCFLATYITSFTWQWQEFSLLLACLLIGLCFFSLHYLYLYFIFQPFTEGMESKGLVYKIIYFLSLGFGYQLFQLESSKTVISLLLFMIIYLIFGYFLVKHLAPKTFVLK